MIKALVGAGSLMHRGGPVVTFPPAQERIVVDVGCGHGLSTFQLSQEFLSTGTIIGVDPRHSCLVTASRLVEKDPRVFFFQSTLEEFARVCRPKSVHYLKMHYCFSDRTFPDIQDIIYDVEHLLCENGMVDIQDYTRSFLFSELQDDSSVHPCFDWLSIQQMFSDWKCLEKNYPSKSSQRVLFQKR